MLCWVLGSVEWFSSRQYGLLSDTRWGGGIVKIFPVLQISKKFKPFRFYSLLIFFHHQAARSSAIIMVIIVSLHLLLAVGFMLYFFHVPGNTDIHNKNVNEAPDPAPASNGTELESAASVVKKPDGDRLEEEADNSSIEKNPAPDTGGGGTGKDETPTVEVKQEKPSDQAPASETEVQKVETPKKEDSAEEG